MHEVDLQRKIIDAVIEIGGWGKKVSNMYVNGIPDLLLVKHISIVNCRPRDTFHTEIKTLNALPIKNGDVVKLAHPLTLLQEKCIMDINKAGGCAAWCLIYTSKTEDMIYLGRTRGDIPTKEEFISRCLRRKRGPGGTSWAMMISPLLEWQVSLNP